MTHPDELMLVAAPTRAGERFVRLLLRKGLPFAALTNNDAERNRLIRLGATRIVRIRTTDHETWKIPEWPVGKVFLFENSLNLCCRYIQICRAWTSQPIYVIRQSANSRTIYRGLGADYVIYTSGDDVSFLLD